MKLNIYLVTATIKGGGEYIPPDPCAGGDYYASKTYVCFVTSSSGKLAREAIKAAYPTAKIPAPRKLGPAHG